MMPMNRMTRITASRYEKQTACAKRDLELRIAICDLQIADFQVPPAALLSMNRP